MISLHTTNGMEGNERMFGIGIAVVQEMELKNRSASILLNVVGWLVSFLPHDKLNSDGHVKG